MENSIKPIEIDDDYADILKIKEQYAYRFGYTRPKEDLIAFKNRTIAAIASTIYDEYDLQFYTRKIFELLGYPYTGVKEWGLMVLYYIKHWGQLKLKRTSLYYIYGFRF